MPSDIVLIGPIRAGKSTLANLCAERLGVPRVPLDQHRWRYYGDKGYDRARASAIQAAEGFVGLYRYRKPFEADAVRRVLADHSRCVFDFGAGHSVYEDPELLAEVQAALKPYPNVVLVLPSADLDESVRLLNERMGGLRSGGLDFVDHFVRHRSNHALARIRLYTKGKTPADTCDEIMRRVTLERRPGAASRRPSVPPRTGERGDAEEAWELDRSTPSQHAALATLRLPDGSGYFAALAQAREQARAREADRLRGLYDRPLPEASRNFANACFGEADTIVEGALLKASIPDDARVRAAKLYSLRLGPNATLRDVLSVDPREGMLPLHDGQTLALLRSPEVPPRVRAAQREALLERFLRRPQRSRYPFLHETIVGWFLGSLEGGAAVKERKELRLGDAGQTQLPAYFTATLARSLGRTAGEIASLHFADNAFIEKALPQPIKDLLLVSAQVSAYLEMLVVHGWREGMRRLVGDVLLFFAIPSLERLAASTEEVEHGGQALELARDPGRLLEEALSGFYDRDRRQEPNEVDVALVLGRLAETLWTEPRQVVDRARRYGAPEAVTH